MSHEEDPKAGGEMLFTLAFEGAVGAALEPRTGDVAAPDKR